MTSAAEYERLKELDRRVMRLDDMSDAEIEEMLGSSVPPEQRYSILQIDEPYARANGRAFCRRHRPS